MSDLEARALALFDEFAELAPRRRAAALASLRAKDPLLHDALLKLLVADAASYALEDSAFDVLPVPAPGQQPLAIDASSLERIGTLLGPWRIDRVLAQGGMGTVYEASRADGQYEKTVALKCIRTEMSSSVLVDAFMRERNHLAKLDHPNIAPLLDGGVEADGSPWFAMRLVLGSSIDEWADQRVLEIEQPEMRDAVLTRDEHDILGMKVAQHRHAWQPVDLDRRQRRLPCGAEPVAIDLDIERRAIPVGEKHHLVQPLIEPMHRQPVHGGTRMKVHE